VLKSQQKDEDKEKEEEADLGAQIEEEVGGFCLSGVSPCDTACLQAV